MPAIDDTPLLKLERVLRDHGVVAALRVLNSRAPHRFTGIYRYTPTILANVHLVDAFVPEVSRGGDVPLEDAYCMLLADHGQVSFGDVAGAPCAAKSASPVVSYCGTLLVRANGEPFGSLCHFDLNRCQRPSTEMPLLQMAAPLFMAALESSSS